VNKKEEIEETGEVVNKKEETTIEEPHIQEIRKEYHAYIANLKNKIESYKSKKPNIYQYFWNKNILLEDKYKTEQKYWSSDLGIESEYKHLFNFDNLSRDVFNKIYDKQQHTHLDENEQKILAEIKKDTSEEALEDIREEYMFKHYGIGERFTTIKNDFDNLITKLYQKFIKDEKKITNSMAVTYNILFNFKDNIITTDNLLKLFEMSTPKTT
jgi:hypothetical protein